MVFYKPIGTDAMARESICYWQRLLLLLSCLSAWPFCAASASSHKSAKPDEAKCVSQINQSTAAIVAQDWVNLERLSQKHAQLCRGVVDDEELSLAYENLATARFSLKRPRAALEAVTACISTYYGNSGCHLLKVQALLDLGRSLDAAEAFVIADRLITHNLERSDVALAAAASQPERELAIATKHNFEAQRRLADSLKKYFQPALTRPNPF